MEPLKSLKDWTPPEGLPNPPTEEELAIIAQIGDADWGELDPRRNWKFWNKPPARRLAFLRDLQEMYTDLKRERFENANRKPVRP